LIEVVIWIELMKLYEVDEGDSLYMNEAPGYLEADFGIWLSTRANPLNGS
jgi:hypothetical protein